MVIIPRPAAKYSKSLIGDQNQPNSRGLNFDGENGANPISASAKCLGTLSKGIAPRNLMSSHTQSRFAKRVADFHVGPLPMHVTQISTPRDRHKATARTRSSAPCQDLKLLM